MGLTEEEVDDLLFLARTGVYDEFHVLEEELCGREKILVSDLLQATKDEHTGNGILHMAAANGHSEFIRKICKALSIPSPQNATMISILNTQNLAGNTPLHWAALNGHLDVVQALMEQGADPTITNIRGHDAIYEAELNDKKEIVDWVLKEGGTGIDQGIHGVCDEKEVVDEANGDATADPDIENLQADL